jgi:NADPH-dependent curcumin reductase CurA
VALCGAVSQYDRSARGPGNLFQATANDLTLRGFRGSSYLHRMPDLVREVSGWLADGGLRYRETIVDGLERAPEALARMLAGDTVGKTLVRIA